jgi:hypothetical protein
LARWIAWTPFASPPLFTFAAAVYNLVRMGNLAVVPSAQIREEVCPKARKSAIRAYNLRDNARKKLVGEGKEPSPSIFFSSPLEIADVKPTARSTARCDNGTADKLIAVTALDALPVSPLAEPSPIRGVLH